MKLALVLSGSVLLILFMCSSAICVASYLAGAGTMALFRRG